jgi:YVTN family beta-propeller protein
MERRSRHSVVAGGAAVALAAAAAVTLTLTHTGGAAPAKPAAAGRPQSVHLISSSCGGPAGAAYVADAGWDGFSAIDTANCKVIQTYNVGDPQVPGDPGDYDYASTDEGVAIHGDTLYFADAGNNSVAVINAAALSPSDYNPAETDIHTGFFPEDLAVSPDGSQLWVADTGPQTSPDSPSDVAVIDTAANKVTQTLPVKGGPSQIAFSPNGTSAYVVTAAGLWTFSTSTFRQTGFTGGLGDPRGVAVSPDGTTIYVTDTDGNSVQVISASTGQVTATIGVGELPWQIVISANGKAAYVADPDSNAVSVIDTATDQVTDTISVPGDPDTLGLTADGSQLWIGQASAAYVTLVDTSDNAVAGSINLGGTTAQSGDGYEPTGIVLTSTPTPGS